MAVDLLDAPLRVGWDIGGIKGLDADQLAVVAQQLIDAGIFFVALEGDPLTSPSIIALLEQLHAGGCQVSMVVTEQSLDTNLLKQIPSTVKLFLDCDFAVRNACLDLDRLLSVLNQIRSTGHEPALSWIPRRGELEAILALLDFCQAENISAFKLPNQKISASSDRQQAAFLPNCKDLEQLSVAITKHGLAQNSQLQFEVHDLFLWELLQPLTGGQRSEYGGCQAANSLGYVAVNGDLWPCASWPQPLGNLLQEQLLDLWQSEARLDIRRQIAEVPIGCEGCKDYSICFGGCRGLSSFCRDDGLKRDLLCADKR